MRLLKRLVAFALGFQFLLFAQVASAQVINRFKDRKTTSKEQESPTRLVPQPPISGPSQGNSASDSTEPAVATERGRLKPIPLSTTPSQSTRLATKTPGIAAKSEQVNALASIPHISIETAGPAEVNLGRRVKYTITIRNEGESATQGIVLYATVPAGVELVETDPKPDISGDRLEYLLGELAPKTATKLHLDLIPRQHGSVDLKTYATISIGASAAIQVRSPEVTVKFSGPAEAIIGDTVMFKATITNTGDGPAENVSVAQLLPRRGDGEIKQTDAVLEQVQSRIERLQPGQTEEIELPAVATAVGLMRANILIKGADGLEAQAAAEVRVRQPAIEIKTVGPDSRPVQRTGGYVILISNTGDVVAEGVVVTAVIPKGLEVVGIEKRTTFDKKIGTLTWNLSQLAAGVTESLKFQVKAVEEGEHKVQVVAVGERKLTAQTAHVIRVAGKADLSIAVDDTPGPIEVGGQATYEVRVKNSGTKTAQNVCIRCTLPRGLEIEPSSDFKLNGLNLEFAAIETLAVGEEKVLQLSAVGREPGDQVIHFTLQCDTLSREIIAETSTFFFKTDK